MPAFKNITGQRFGRLVVLQQDDTRSRIRWLCRCDCSKECSVSGSNLRTAAVRSCGCLLHEFLTTRFLTHGESKGINKTAEYRCWVAMHTRCTNPKQRAWKHYGGRGIRVCERWNSFENFLADMGRKPTSQHSIDRIDVNGNYEPLNCRWATPVQQVRNRRAGATGS